MGMEGAQFVNKTIPYVEAINSMTFASYITRYRELQKVFLSANLRFVSPMYIIVQRLQQIVEVKWSVTLKELDGPWINQSWLPETTVQVLQRWRLQWEVPGVLTGGVEMRGSDQMISNVPISFESNYW